MTKKLDIFADKEYQDMDWLGKVVEPYIFPLNEVLSQFPSRYDLSFDDILPFFNDYYQFDKADIVRLIAQKNNISISANDLNTLKTFMTINLSHDVVINLSNKTIQGEFAFICSKSSLEDEEIKEVVANSVSHILNNLNGSESHRLNDVMDILGVVTSRPIRSGWRKRNEIIHKYRDIILEDKWRLRSAPLAEKVAQWIVEYADTGNLAALSNVTRLKCMTHSGNPIYSMEETI